MKKRALISVYDKKGVLELASRLSKLGFEILSTGGTLALLTEGGISAAAVSDITKFPECLDGRVKTLHPSIHGGILAERGKESHMRQLESLGIGTIDLVFVNLYPFEKAIKQQGAQAADAVENIDIGGPAMIRSAAKNYEYVAVATDPSDYGVILSELEETGEVSLATRKKLAAKAFQLTAFYDSLISRYFSEELFPEYYTIGLRKLYSLRYGENPHQSASFYDDPMDAQAGIGTAEILWGKELSYNNIADADAAVAAAMDFADMPASANIKHQNPCAIAVGESIAQAYQKAYDADPVSIYGGVVALTRPVGRECAELLNKSFLEIVIAPEYSEEALSILKQREDLRILRLSALSEQAAVSGLLAKKVAGGMLLSEHDSEIYASLSYPTKRQPTPQELTDLIFAFKAVKHAKSNAITLAKDGVLVGCGPGQPNRIGSLEIAASMAGERAIGSVMASDAFFPFDDTVKAAIKAGVSAIIQPGGSNRDEDSIKAADEAGIAMVFTGMRHFKH
ncbi:MAG: bifunctional phosphoribosylaminoimidazolecarboxamide formyltransferase/IMP cyclohydrolase [Eubacteriaceae bacterium]|nr:bifunctional phosphoribosylaminoimidazolecarboxamide formyltransferase/IMP cyclohydrolase [Eubacteriaceae bacterium]